MLKWQNLSFNVFLDGKNLYIPEKQEEVTSNSQQKIQRFYLLT